MLEVFFMAILGLLVLIFFSGKMATNGQSGLFKSESLRKMVYPRVFSSPVILDNIIYVVGGCDQMGQPVDSFEMYDIGKNKWTTLQSMPTKRAAPAVGGYGGTAGV